MIDRSIISQVLSQAISLMAKGDSLSEEMFSIWFDYSCNMLKLACSYDSLTPLYYMNFALNLRINGLSPIQRLDACFNYLNSIT